MRKLGVLVAATTVFALAFGGVAGAASVNMENTSKGGGSLFVGAVSWSSGNNYTTVNVSANLDDTKANGHCAAVVLYFRDTTGSLAQVRKFNCSGSGVAVPVVFTQSAASGRQFTAVKFKVCNALYYSATNYTLSDCSVTRRILGYVNPISTAHWQQARTDQGVDWQPKDATDPVLAVGDGVVTFSSTNTGWPSGAYIVYRLTSGPARGKYVFVAEHLKDLLPVGTKVYANHRVATAIAGYPWTEWGWSAPSGNCSVPATPYNGAPNGTPMPAGKAFVRFLKSTGMTYTYQDPGPGSILPSPTYHC